YQIDQLHQASQRGNIHEFQYLLDRYSLICSRDRLGATPLHKAVLFGHYDLIKFIIKNFDQNILYIGDNEKRTPLHYAAGLVDDENHSIYYLLLKYGPKASIIVDKKNHTADHYLRSPNELNILNLRKHLNV
ncbi:putative serine/threonine-protein kinase DDB_G0278535, partial [Dermatophagoides pteronyssinus]|uniref:putative serine/threonine-protein kinase DDB_G0278535 n=1 Tax=Dermatophagoides pteronyssinus TaxID=6956 RepID=UPI003F673F0B